MAYFSKNPRLEALILTEQAPAGAKNPAAGSRKMIIDTSGDLFIKDSAGSSVQVGGIGSINGLTTGTQTFAVGTAGTNFNIVSAGSAHTFNIPDASGANRGLVTTGAQTFGGVKTFTAPNLGTPTSGLLSACTGLPIIGGTTGTLSVARGGTGVTSMASVTGIPIVSGTTGTLSVARGGTGVTGSTGTGSVVLSIAPALTGATTMAATGNVKAISVTGSHANEYVGTFTQGTGGSTASVLALVFGPATTADASWVDFVGDGNSYGAIARAGSIMEYQVASDERIKADIKPIKHALPRVRGILAGDYLLKHEGVRQEGFLAQQLLDWCPGAVRIGGDDPRKKPWMVSYQRVIPLHNAAITELADMFDESQREIMTLRERIETLEV